MWLRSITRDWERWPTKHAKGQTWKQLFWYVVLWTWRSMATVFESHFFWKTIYLILQYNSFYWLQNSIKATYQGKAQFSLRNHVQIKTKRYTYQVFGEMVLWSHCRILHCLDNRKKFKLTTPIIMQGHARSSQKRVVCKWQFMEASMITLVDIECSWIFLLPCI